MAFTMLGLFPNPGRTYFQSHFLSFEPSFRVSKYFSGACGAFVPLFISLDTRDIILKPHKAMLTSKSRTENVYLITPPFFESVSVKSPLTGKTATIRNIGFDAVYNNIYIQSATLNGKPYTKNWIGHEFFTEGQTLVLTLGRNESEWGTRAADLPPSLSTSGGSTGGAGNMSFSNAGGF